MNFNNPQLRDHFLQYRQFFLMLTGFCIAMTLASCETVTTNQYEAHRTNNLDLASPISYWPNQR
jgi:hypothetical protein